MVKASLLVNLSLLLLGYFSFTVFAQEQDSESFAASPPHHHGGYYPVSPAAAPGPHHHHHHHQHHQNSTKSPPAYPPSHHHHHHGHPPAHPPVHPPAHAPVHPPPHPPIHPPVKPPHHQPYPHPPPAAPLPPRHPPKHPFPRSFVAVQGVVYCKSCKYPGVDTLTGASPVPGAVVKLQCNNTFHPQEVVTKTDKNGYFYTEAPKTITNYGVHKCKVFLVSSPLATCQKPSPLHGGTTGATLRPEKPFTSNNRPFVLFSVGPFAFEPKCY